MRPWAQQRQPQRITDSLVHRACGIEDADDLIAELSQAPDVADVIAGFAQVQDRVQVPDIVCRVFGACSPDRGPIGGPRLRRARSR